MAERHGASESTMLIDGRGERRQEPPSHSVAFIGVGAGTLGLMARPDATGRLDDLLKRGAGFYDKHSFGSQTLNFTCDSNSLDTDFANILAADGTMMSGSVREVVTTLQEGIPVTLQRAHSFYRSVGEQLQNIVNQDDIVPQRVSYVVCNPRTSVDDPRRFTLYGGEDQKEKEVIGYANKVVLGTGASQELSPQRVIHEGQSTYTSEQVLSGDRQSISELHRRLSDLDPEQRKIAILGISHGALATAAELLKYDQANGNILGEGAIQLIGKTEPELYYQTKTEAEKEYGRLGRSVNEELVAPNDAYARLVGMRAGSKDLYLAVQEGRERRVTVTIQKDTKNLWEEDIVRESPVAIQAFGLHTNLVPIYQQEQNGRLSIITVVNDKGSVPIGANGNLYTAVGNDIGLFGTGIGYQYAARSDAIAAFAGPGEPPAKVTAANAYATDFADALIPSLLG